MVDIRDLFLELFLLARDSLETICLRNHEVLEHSSLDLKG